MHPIHRLPRVATFALLLAAAPLTPTLALAQTPRELAAAAEQGDAEAQFKLGRLYFRGEALPKDLSRAADLFQKAAAQGHAEAEGSLGFLYSNGLGVGQDDAQAIAWFKKAAEKGSAKAQFNLGKMLLDGRGVPKDEAAGFPWIVRAADQAMPEAANLAGEAYYFGEFGQSKDLEKAFPLLQKAASAGFANAQNNFGVMLRDGDGVRRNVDEAAVWFRKAAEQGNTKAQSNLGHLLYGRAGERAQKIEGLKWLMLARQLEVTADKTLAEVRPRLPEADVAEARTLADAFKPTKPAAR